MTRYPSGTAVASPLPSVVCWCALVAFLSALLAALHHTAVQKSQLVDVFAVVTPDTIKKIQERVVNDFEKLKQKASRR